MEAYRLRSDDEDIKFIESHYGNTNGLLSELLTDSDHGICTKKGFEVRKTTFGTHT